MPYSASLGKPARSGSRAAISQIKFKPVLMPLINTWGDGERKACCIGAGVVSWVSVGWTERGLGYGIVYANAIGSSNARIQS
jgi:hypothetical protein